MSTEHDQAKVALPQAPVNVWAVEAHDGYRKFLHACNEGMPLHTGFCADGTVSKVPPGYVVGRTLVMAEMRCGRFSLGVMLSDGSEFWTPWDGSFQELLDHEVSNGC